MITDNIARLKKLAHSRWYWATLLSTGVTLLAVALIYQHALGERPCLLCIQIRLWVSLLIIISSTGLFTRHCWVMSSIAHASLVLVAVGLVERSYQLLGTERGFVFGDCGFDLGLPAWFAIDQWLPSVYYVHTSCGYTPELIFGITMAEALMAFSAGLLLVSVSVALASFLRARDQ